MVLINSVLQHAQPAVPEGNSRRLRFQFAAENDFVEEKFLSACTPEF
jgi:hypothetical protein